MVKQYMAKNGNVFLRKEASPKTPVLKLIPEGAVVEAQSGEENGWLYVVYEGAHGYCLAKHLTLCEEPQYDDDSIGAAIETAIANVYASLDELKKLIHLL